MIDLSQKYLKVKIRLLCDVSEDILMVKFWQTRQFSGVLLNTKGNSSTLLYVYEHPLSQPKDGPYTLIQLLKSRYNTKCKRFNVNISVSEA